ncbi:MAG: hypothetical protein D3910_00265 [Candidatus Electrothrix sp. ATG2]|nr:hypothetical protein [Candidatus Electrothrix sp. ATG2]
MKMLGDLFNCTEQLSFFCYPALKGRNGCYYDIGGKKIMSMCNISHISSVKGEFLVAPHTTILFN